VSAHWEFDLRLEAEVGEALKLQRPLPDDALRVSQAAKKDRPVIAA
jgi:hypothetical protein